ncbi:MAG: hypothetical protein ACREHD_29560 [Pirellulales bacterium]
MKTVSALGLLLLTTFVVPAQEPLAAPWKHQDIGEAQVPGTAKIATPGYDTEAVFRRLGRAGHIGFEVHDVNLKSPLGQDRWAIGAVCRWRNISITEL